MEGFNPRTYGAVSAKLKRRDLPPPQSVSRKCPVLLTLRIQHAAHMKVLSKSIHPVQQFEGPSLRVPPPPPKWGAPM